MEWIGDRELLAGVFFATLLESEDANSDHIAINILRAEEDVDKWQAVEDRETW